MSLIDELKGVLERRRNVLEIFGTYKTMYDELLQDLAKTHETDVDTAITAFYLTNYVMDYIQDSKDARDRTDDTEPVKIVLENLMEARKHLTLDFKSLVNLYSLIYDWGIKIEKELVKNARLLINQNVIMTNIVDVYVVPLFSFLNQAIPKLDLRWAMAELTGALNKDFAASYFDNIKNKFPIATMDSQFYFDAGFFVIQPFVEDYFAKKYEDGLKELESFGDIGRKSYEFACSIIYDKNSRELFSQIAYDDQVVSTELLEEELRNSLHINYSLSRLENPYQLIFAKFVVKIKEAGERSEERFFYIHNFEEEDQAKRKDSDVLGNWNYFLLSNEDVNLESIISYSKQRCVDIRGILRHLNTQGITSDNHIKLILSAWMDMYIHNLQEEYNFLEMKDELREQGFIPVGLLKQDKNQTNVI
ncbi:MAG: hypothetical protein ACXACR_12845, partial [Candidatus Hodarchaeales archaeon]